jgi:hypothetical protein
LVLNIYLGILSDSGINPIPDPIPDPILGPILGLIPDPILDLIPGSKLYIYLDIYLGYIL